MKKITLIVACVFACGFINAQPAIQWQKCLGGISDDRAYSIQQTSDWGYIIAGSSPSVDGDVTGNHGGLDYWIVKLDSLGALLWQKSFGGTDHEEAYSVSQTADGGYVVAGYTNSNDADVTGNHGAWDYWVVKLDNMGTLQWQKSLGGTGFDRAWSIKQTADGGYVVAGTSESIDGDVTGNHGISDYWVVKLDGLGIIQWQKSLGGTGNDEAHSIKQTTDGGYIIAGASSSNDGDVTGNHGFGDFWVVKLDNMGIVQWQKSLGGTLYDNGWSINQTLDMGYIVAGWSASNDGDVTGHHGSAYDDYWIVKLDNLGAVQWQKSLGGTNEDYTNSMQQTIDGGYIIAGASSSNDGDVTGSHGGYDYWVVKLDGFGTLQWEKSLGGTNDEREYSIWQTNDGGCITAGRSLSNDGDVTGNHGNNDYWVVKLASLVGIEEEVIYESINLFPNPATSEITVASAGFTVERIEMWSVVGEKCLTPTLSKGEGVRLDVSALPAGIYFVAVTDAAGNRAVRKVVKM
jgi:hypothetical protein